MELAGRVAIVTGAAAGIGRAIAEDLSAEGAHVVSADLKADAGTFRADMALADDVRKLFAFTLEEHGRLDVLVNNAGGVFETWQQTVDVNLSGLMLATQLALEAMRGEGAIVNISSVAGLGRTPYSSPDYAAAKAAVVRFTAALADHGGVRVNCVCPDWVDTPAVQRSLAEMSPEDAPRFPNSSRSRRSRRSCSTWSATTLTPAGSSRATQTSRGRGSCRPTGATDPVGRLEKVSRRLAIVPGVVLVAVAAAMWGTDALFRRPLAQSTSAATIVFGEHLLLVALTLPWLVPALRAVYRAGPRYILAAVAVGAGASALATILFTQAFVHGDPITPVVLQKVQPLIVIVGARIVLGEQPRRRFVWFLVPALVGVWLIALPYPFDVHARGLEPIAVALGAAVLWGLGTVFGRYLARRIAFEQIVTLRFAFGLVASAVALLVLDAAAFAGAHDSLWIAYLGLVTGFAALMLYYYGLQRTPAILASLAELAYPVTAVIVGYVAFDATLRWTQWVGVLITSRWSASCPRRAEAARHGARRRRGAARYGVRLASAAAVGDGCAAGEVLADVDGRLAVDALLSFEERNPVRGTEGDDRVRLPRRERGARDLVAGGRRRSRAPAAARSEGRARTTPSRRPTARGAGRSRPGGRRRRRDAPARRRRRSARVVAGRTRASSCPTESGGRRSPSCARPAPRRLRA